MNWNSIELIDETQSSSKSELAIIASEIENEDLKVSNRLDEGIVVSSGRDYYRHVKLDYLTFLNVEVAGTKSFLILTF